MGEYGTPNIDIEEGYIDMSITGGATDCHFRSNLVRFTTFTKVHDSQTLPSLAGFPGSARHKIRARVLFTGTVTAQTERHPGLINRLDYDGVLVRP